MELNGIYKNKIRKIKNIVLALFFIVFFSGCSILPGMQNLNASNMPRKEIPELVNVRPIIIPITPTLIATKAVPPYIYHIYPQDVLSIVVWQHPEFIPPAQITATLGTQSSQAAGQTGYLVNHNGFIYFPLVGYVHVAGETVDQIRVKLTKRLREYVRNPQVMVRVADYRSKKIYMFGEVMKPGLLPLNDQPMSITDAILLAGSFDPNAADTRHIYVIRGNFLRPRIYWLDAKTPYGLLLAEKFELQPDDIIYVSSAVVARWNRFLNQLLPTLQTLYFTKALIDWN